METEEIAKLLPHRYPFLMVDRVIEMNKEQIKAIKNVTINEQFFVGHFMHQKVMPGVLILEALAQTAAIKVLKQRELTDTLFYLASISNAKFRLQVKPGDRLTLIANETYSHKSRLKFKCAAYVEEKLAASMDLLAVMDGVKN